MIKITLPLVDELQREKGIVVPRQTEGALSATLSDNRKEAEPITEEHNRQTEKRDKNGGLKSAAVSTGVIKTNSLGLGEEREGKGKNRPPLLISFLRSVFPLNEQEERRVVYVGRLRSDCTRTELKRRFEVFGEIEECAVNLRDDG